MDIVVGGQQMLQLVEGSTDFVRTPDNVLLGVGGEIDFYMNHDGTDSVLQNNTGDLTIKTTTADKDIILMSDDGSGGETAYITLDGSIAKTTLNKDLRAVDDVKITAGNGDDFQIFHNATNTFVKNNTGDFYISNDADDKDLILRSEYGS